MCFTSKFLYCSFFVGYVFPRRMLSCSSSGIVTSAVLLLALFSDLISCVVFLLYCKHCYLAVTNSLVKREQACRVYLWFVKCMLSVEVRSLRPIGFIVRLCSAIVDFQSIVYRQQWRSQNGIIFTHILENLENHA